MNYLQVVSSERFKEGSEHGSVIMTPSVGDRAIENIENCEAEPFISFSYTFIFQVATYLNEQLSFQVQCLAVSPHIFGGTLS